MATKSLKPSRAGFSPLHTRVNCLVVKDFGFHRVPAVEFFQIADKRDALQAVRLCEHFHHQNRAALKTMNCHVSSQFENNQVYLTLQASNMVGAVPLKSPTRASDDYGLVVQPRFEWGGIGPMLSEMGWNVVPRPLKMPVMKTSERRVPPWVLSSMVLHRLKGLLDSLGRRFEIVSEIRRVPRGSVNWSAYALTYVSHGDLQSVPCSFPDLQEDRNLRGAIRFALERQLGSLSTQRQSGKFVHDLIEFCTSLLTRVRNAQSAIPTVAMMQSWSRASLAGDVVLDGLQAIEWTVDERGLAGLSELSGLPWIMPMDDFYENWVETVFRVIARRASCTIKTSRKRETTKPINWNPAYLGSQKSLRPDLWLERDGLTIIVDAKYKRHWEELRIHSFREFEKEMQEHHRNDLMQALAYANLSSAPHTITCLAYPCSRQSWDDMKQRRRIVHKARIPSGDRTLELWLLAIPMAVPAREIADEVLNHLNSTHHQEDDRQ